MYEMFKKELVRDNDEYLKDLYFVNKRPLLDMDLIIEDCLSYFLEVLSLERYRQGYIKSLGDLYEDKDLAFKMMKINLMDEYGVHPLEFEHNLDLRQLMSLAWSLAAGAKLILESDLLALLKVDRGEIKHIYKITRGAVNEKHNQPFTLIYDATRHNLKAMFDAEDADAEIFRILAGGVTSLISLDELNSIGRFVFMVNDDVILAANKIKRAFEE